MSDLGPSWLRQDLPYPIASAWHRATLEAAPDGIHMAIAVESALRLMTGLQLAARLASGHDIPKMLTGGRFERPSLGSWVELALELRTPPSDMPLRKLLAWPGRDAKAALEKLVALRNDLAHRTQDGAKRDQLDREIGELAVGILESLEPLRRTGLIQILDAVAEGQDLFEGRTQRFVGLNPNPESERICWQGVAKHRHLYFEAEGLLLDASPFVAYGLLQGANASSLLLWAGIDERGDVLVRDDDERVGHRPTRTDGPRVRPFERLDRARDPNERTLPDRAPLLPRGTAPGRTNRAPTPPHADATAQSAPTLAGERLQSGRSSAARGGGTRVRGQWQILAIVLGLAGVAAGGLALWMNRPSPAAVAPSASPCNEIPPFDGGWTFDTVILGGRPGREAGFGVRGHYRLELSGLTRSGQGACAMGGLLVKRGYTMNGKEYGPVLRARIAGRISPRGESMSYLARLARELPPAGQDRPGAAPAPGTITADIAMRLARHGDALVGLWRHEGDDRERAGYWGALVGRRDAASAALPDDRCFSDCVRACHGDADPLDVATEGCLMRCAPKIDDCPR